MIEIVICIALIGMFIQYIVMYSSIVNRMRIEQSIKLRNTERVDYIRNHIKYNCDYEEINKNLNKILYLTKEDIEKEYKISSEVPEENEYISISVTEGDSPYLFNIEIIAVEGEIEVCGIVYKGKSVEWRKKDLH